jgi:hypothetical protein
MTTPGGLVLDMFQFAGRPSWFHALNPGASDAVLHAIEDVVAGPIVGGDRLAGPPARTAAPARGARSRQLERIGDWRRLAALLGARDRPPATSWVLYRISAVSPNRGCEIDLVLIATEGRRRSTCSTSPGAASS